MGKFSLDKWLKDKSRKVVTRLNKQVQIISTEGKEDIPIVALVDGVAHQYKPNGYHADVVVAYTNQCLDMGDYDLFFADEEKTNKILDELKSYLENTPKEQVEKDWKEIQDWYSQHFTNEKHNEKEELTEFEKEVFNLINFYGNEVEEAIVTNAGVKEIASKLFDLARKELLKDLPKLKKATEHKEFEVHVCVMDEDMYPYLDTEVNEGECYIELNNLKTLPKE